MQRSLSGRGVGESETSASVFSSFRLSKILPTGISKLRGYILLLARGNLKNEQAPELSAAIDGNVESSVVDKSVTPLCF